MSVVLTTRISEGRAGDIVRNPADGGRKGEAEWARLSADMAVLFQVVLSKPEYEASGEISAEYYNGLPLPTGRNPHPKLDIASGGSGFHQVLLLLAFLYGRPGTVLRSMNRTPIWRSFVSGMFTRCCVKSPRIGVHNSSSPVTPR